MKRILFFTLLYLIAQSIHALPPYMPVNERIRTADVVLLARVVDSGDIQLTSRVASARVRLAVEKVLKNKNKHRISKQFTIQYIVWPDSVETVQAAPENGRYFVFLRERYLTLANGKQILIYEPIDPRPFAYAQYDSDTEKEIESALKK